MVRQRESNGRQKRHKCAPGTPRWNTLEPCYLLYGKHMGRSLGRSEGPLFPDRAPGPSLERSSGVFFAFFCHFWSPFGVPFGGLEPHQHIWGVDPQIIANQQIIGDHQKSSAITGSHQTSSNKFKTHGQHWKSCSTLSIMMGNTCRISF